MTRRRQAQAPQSRQQALEALKDVYFLCGQSLELDDILRCAPEKIMGIAGGDIVLVFLLDEGGHQLELVAHLGASDTFVADVERLRLGDTLSQFLSTLDQPVVESVLKGDGRLPQAAVAREGIESGVLVPVRARGRVFGALCVGTRSRRRFSDEDVQLLAACGNAIGIAIENARLYQRVRASELRYRNIFERANDAIFAHDLEGHIVAANSACARLTGYSPDELASMLTRDIVHPDDLENAQALERRMVEGGLKGEDRFEVRLMRKDGSEVTVELTTTVIGGRGQPPGILHIARDVTEQLRVQESLHSYVRQITRAQEEERLRISRDLHDETAQSLLLVSQRLDGLTSDSRWNLGDEAREYVGGVRQLALQCLADLRRVAEALRPRILDDLGLAPAVGWLADELRQQEGIAANVEVRGDVRDLPREQQVLLFRIAQEALSNVRRHAQAHRVDVTIEFDPAEVGLTVRDDGMGFSMPARPGDLAATGKLGILGMMERARLLGGRMSLRSEPGGGTTVSVSAPV